MSEDDPNTRPVPPAGEQEPQWAINLRNLMESLPGKLQATVTDDDRRGIAESVHGLFEQSGAFHKAEPAEDDPADDDPPATDDDPPPEKVSGMKRFASWFAGER